MGCPFFKKLNLDSRVQRRLSSIATCLKISKGTVLFRQGDPPGNCYVILEGSVGIVKPDEETKTGYDSREGTPRLGETLRLDRTEALGQTDVVSDSLSECERESTVSLTNPWRKPVPALSESRRSSGSQFERSTSSPSGRKTLRRTSSNRSWQPLEDSSRRSSLRSERRHQTAARRSDERRESSKSSVHLEEDMLSRRGSELPDRSIELQDSINEEMAMSSFSRRSSTKSERRVSMESRASEKEMPRRELSKTSNLEDRRNTSKGSVISRSRTSLVLEIPQDDGCDIVSTKSSEDFRQNRSEDQSEHAVTRVKSHEGFSVYHDNSRFGTQVVRLERNALFGELALMGDQPRAATAKCLEDCELLVIARHEFDNLLKADLDKQKDETTGFLRQHVPGMSDIPEKPRFGKPPASYYFKHSSVAKGYVFLKQGEKVTDRLWVLQHGVVEFWHSDPPEGRNSGATPRGAKRRQAHGAALSETREARDFDAMVILDDGPAADFGSLSAFLGVPSQKLAPKVAKEPEPNARDTTLLNKKVAFRMLKQLGCEVRQEEEASFVEVSLARQPVLFKMLVELGHAPRKAEGELLVRVKEQRPRKPEDLIASLSQPRKTEATEEGYPVVGRPRLRPEDAQQLVERLYKVPKEVPKEKAEVAKPRRTAAEQRAYLDRLLKPREDPPPNTEADFEKAMPGLGIAWPNFSNPTARVKRKPKALAPLAQAGQLVLAMKREEEGVRSKPSTPNRRKPEVHDGFESTSSTSSQAKLRRSMDEEAFESKSSPSQSPSPGEPDAESVKSEPSRSSTREDTASFANEAPAPEAPEAEGKGEENQVESTDEWLDRLLGPLEQKQRPKRKELRLDRLEELAKPRVVEPAPQIPPSAARPRPRSPRAQQDACNRLAQPRLRREKEKAEKPDREREEQTEHSGDEEAEPAPVVIPSMLAQCRLDRIDEEGAHVRRSQASLARPRSQAAAPYAVPVCPALKKDRRDRCDRRAERRRRHEQSPAEEEEAEDEGEAVLQDISDLYNQFIGSLSSSQVEDLETEEPQSESPDPAPEGPEGEELLASIDQLYCQMMEEGKLEHDAPDAHEEADGEQLAELSALLEELLWSALLLARGTGAAHRPAAAEFAEPPR
ncbi:unnamed protein product [Effrenium voratum]|nr:unnamed protein product [Effrenium voratum]